MTISSNKLHFLMKLAAHAKSAQNSEYLQQLEGIPISQWTYPYIEAEVEKKKKSSLLKKLLMLGLLGGGAYGAYKFLPKLFNRTPPQNPPWPEANDALAYISSVNNPADIAAASISNDLSSGKAMNLPEDLVSSKLNDYNKIINIPSEQRAIEDATLGNTVTSGFSPYGAVGPTATLINQHPAFQSILKTYPKLKNILNNITASSNSIPKSWIEAQQNLNEAQKAWDSEASEAIPNQAKLDQLTTNLQQARSVVSNEDVKFNTEQLNNSNRATSRTWSVPESLYDPTFPTKAQNILSTNNIQLRPNQLNNLINSGFAPDKLNDALISQNISLDQIDSINNSIDSNRSLISNPTAGMLTTIAPALVNMMGGGAGYFDTTRDIKDTIDNFRFKAPELGDTPSIGTNARGLGADLASQFVGNTLLGTAGNVIKAPFTGYKQLLPNLGNNLVNNLKDISMLRGPKALGTNLANNARFGLLANTGVNVAGKALPTYTDFARNITLGNMNPTTAITRAGEAADNRAITGYNTRENQAFLNDRLPDYLREQDINFDPLKSLTPQEWMQVKGTSFSPNQLASILIGNHGTNEQQARDLGSAMSRAYKTDLRTRDLYRGNPAIDFNSFKNLPNLILSGGFDPNVYDKMMASLASSRQDQNIATRNFMEGNERYARGAQNIARNNGEDYVSPLSQLNPRDYQHLMDFGSNTLLSYDNGKWINKAKPSMLNLAKNWNYISGRNTARDLYGRVRGGAFPSKEFTMATNLPVDKPDQLAAGLGFNSAKDLGDYYNKQYTPYLSFNVPKAAPNPLKVNPLN